MTTKIGWLDHSCESCQTQAAELRRLQAENEELRKDAERWRYAVAIGENLCMNWLDVYDDWDGDGEFTDAIDSAAKEQTP